MGYLSPIPDNGGGGSEAYDVYLIDIGNEIGIYGYTELDETSGFSSFMVLDNDFSPLDSFKLENGKKVPVFYTTGYNGLKITAAHEFHHAIQDMYGEPFPNVPLLHEMSSTWMEYRLYPYIKDFFQYLPGLFNSLSHYAFGDGKADNGYRWSIFSQYLHFHYGDSLLLRMWELIGSSKNGYRALDSAFREQGTSLEYEWCRFKPWMYFTGSRAIPGKYFEEYNS